MVIILVMIAVVFVDIEEVCKKQWYDEVKTTKMGKFKGKTR